MLPRRAADGPADLTRPTPATLLVLACVLGFAWVVAPPRATVAATPPAPSTATSAAASPTHPAFLPGVKRALFLGDSITYSGQYVDAIETWTRLMVPDQAIEFLNLGLPSETVSGLSEPGHAGGAFPRPDLHERLSRVLTQSKPDLVFACYGMNDGIYYPFGEDRFARYQDGIRRLRQAVTAAGARLIHITPPVFDPLPLKGRTLPAGRAEYPQPYEGYNDVLDRYSAWLVSQRREGWEVIDIHSPMNRYLAERRTSEPNFRLAGDGVHLNAAGHWLIAREILAHLGAPAELREAPDLAGVISRHPRGQRVIPLVQQRQALLKDAWLNTTRHLRPGMAKGLPLPEAETKARDLQSQIEALARPFPGRKSAWHGFDRYDFVVEGRPVLVVAPTQPAPGRPWVWHGEFFGHKPAPDIALLKAGYHVVYMSVPDMLGSPQAVEYWNAFYKELTSQYGFHPKPALVGLSRGGLYCYNWAIANPDRVACIYGDAPVCDFKSWPGGKGKGKGSPRDWQLVLAQYKFGSEAEALAYRGNPVDQLAPLAARKVPLLHVYGDADEVVPWDENTKVIADRYNQLGAPITLIAKPGVGHHPHGLDNPQPIVDFIRAHTQP